MKPTKKLCIIVKNLPPPSIDGESHDDIIPEGAIYGNLETGTFYSEMHETVSVGDVYLYGDYMYSYEETYYGWVPILAVEGVGIETYLPDYPLTNRTQRSYDDILTSINGVNIAHINELSFSGCYFLESVSIPDSVKEIGVRTFNGCNSLKNVVFGRNSQLTEIGDSAFRDCSSLTSIDIPVGVTHIGCFAFYYCTNLGTITFGGTMAQWNAISKDNSWNTGVPATYVKCSDGNVSLDGSTPPPVTL